jgi:hypothetical protein
MLVIAWLGYSDWAPGIGYLTPSLLKESKVTLDSKAIYCSHFQELYVCVNLANVG